MVKSIVKTDLFATTVTQLLLIGLKIGGKIEYSWWIILAPVILLLAILILALSIAWVESMIKIRDERRKANRVEMTRNERIIEDSKRNGIPIIVFTAKDRLSMNTIADYYHNSCLSAKCNLRFMQALNEKITEFREWQEANPDKVKTPD